MKGPGETMVTPHIGYRRLFFKESVARFIRIKKMSSDLNFITNCNSTANRVKRNCIFPYVMYIRLFIGSSGS